MNAVPGDFDLATIATNAAPSLEGTSQGMASRSRITRSDWYFVAQTWGWPVRSVEGGNAYPSMYFSYLPGMNSQNWNGPNVIDLSQVNSSWVAIIKNKP